MKDTELVPQSNNLDLIKVDTTKLNEESLALINQIIEENNIEKAKDLTYLFNINQNKKTMVRVNKLNELLDVITDQAVDRFTKKPDEISNKELLDSLKTVQDLIERGSKQVSGVADTMPLIQINQQTNSVNMGENKGTQNYSRDSRERVKKAVLELLGEITSNAANNFNTEDSDIIEVEESTDDK
jgi:hypothetical protein